ncbi:MAG: TonB-dependent receptor [Myxococcales bacterium]|nr:TonB-dependent receptor [Myxococcales bacterium]
MVGRGVPLWAALLVSCLCWAAQPLTGSAQDAPAAPEATPPAEPAPPPAEAPAAPAPPAAEVPAAPPAEAPTTGEQPVTPAEAPAAPPAAAPAPEPTQAEASAEPSTPGEGEAAPETPHQGPTDDEPIDEEPAADGDVEEILITGSRIKRTSFSAAAPIQVVDREQLEFSGAQNLGEVVRFLTAAPGSDFGGRGLGLFGTTQINLRGLGTQATLILINGRRVVPAGAVSISGSGIGTIVDLGQIPVTAIERIEILRGGGSAIYGSDAVAGVVNVITVKDYDGAKIELSAQSTDKLDHAEYVTSLTMGSSGERARANISVVYVRQDRLGEAARDFTKVADPNLVGNPATYIYDPTSPGIMERARPADLPPADLEPGVHPDPDCEDAPHTEIDPENFCTFHPRAFDNLMDARERISMLGFGEYDLTDHTRMFAEVGMSNMRNQGNTIPSLPVLLEVYVPWNHIDNPWGQTVQYIGSVLPASAGPDLIQAEDFTTRVAFGLMGDFEDLAANTIAESWDWELVGTWGRSHYTVSVPDTVADRLQTALNSCSDPDDLSNCFNPFHSANNGEGTPNSREVLSGFLANLTSQNDSWLTTAGAGLSGGLFELPGGDLGFAIGAQWRREERTSDVDHDGNNLRYGFTVGNSDGRAARDIASAYLELAWPFYSGIELTTAGRVEHYEDTGGGVSPSVGLTVQPAEIVGREQVIEELRLLEFKANATRAFRAPSVYEAFPGFVTTFATFEMEGATPVTRPVRAFGSPDLEPEEAIIFSVGMSWAPIDEIALTGDYWNYDYDNRIVAQSALAIYNEDPNNEEHIMRDSGGRLQGASVNLRNAEFVRTDGIDFGVMFKFDITDESILSFGADGTYVMSFDIPAESIPMPEGEETPFECDSDSCNAAGNRNTANFAPPIPDLRMNTPVIFKHGEHAFSLTGHILTGMEDDGAPDGEGGFAAWPTTVTLDLTYGYTFKELIGESTTLRLGVLNLLDLEPPVVEGTNRYWIATHDPRGRLIYVKLTQEL